MTVTDFLCRKMHIYIFFYIPFPDVHRFLRRSKSNSYPWIPDWELLIENIARATRISSALELRFILTLILKGLLGSYLLKPKTEVGSSEQELVTFTRLCWFSTITKPCSAVSSITSASISQPSEILPYMNRHAAKSCFSVLRNSCNNIS